MGGGAGFRTGAQDGGEDVAGSRLGLCLAACQKGFPVLITSTASLVNRLMEACDGRQLSRLQAQPASVKLLIVDEFGFVPLLTSGAELLFEIFSHCGRGSTMLTSNLPFEEWTSVLDSELLTGRPPRPAHPPRAHP